MNNTVENCVPLLLRLLLADNKEATDIYFRTSFLLNRLLKEQKGIWERPPGGMKIRVPLEYDGQEAGLISLN